MIGSVLAIAIFLVAVLMSGVFSGGETGMYQLSRVRLRLSMAQQDRLALMLSKSLADRSGLLVAILVGNNLTVQVATSTVTLLFVNHMTNDHAAEWMATLVTTPILFVFGELLPKNLFLYRSDSLMPLISPVLYGLDKLLRWVGLTPLLKAISHGFARWLGTSKPSKRAAESLHRNEMNAIVRDTQEEGFVSGIQAGIMNRLVIASTTPVKTVMTRMKFVQSVHLDEGRERLVQLLRNQRYTRTPVYDGGQVVGYVNLYQCLGHHQAFDDLRGMVQPIVKIDGDTPVTDAIDLMQRGKHKIALVTRKGRKESTQAAGILTMKDLAEELLGELAVW